MCCFYVMCWFEYADDCVAAAQRLSGLFTMIQHAAQGGVKLEGQVLVHFVVRCAEAECKDGGSVERER